MHHTAACDLCASLWFNLFVVCFASPLAFSNHLKILDQARLHKAFESYYVTEFLCVCNLLPH